MATTIANLTAKQDGVLEGMLTTLNVGPTLAKSFQTYRYLRTPEEPVKRTSPRRVFLMVMWGIVGALVGAGVALARRRTQ